jgi:hypothetical protein
MNIFDLIPRDKYAHDFEVVSVAMLENPVRAWRNLECTKAVSFMGRKGEDVVIWYCEFTILVLGEKPL